MMLSAVTVENFGFYIIPLLFLYRAHSYRYVKAFVPAAIGAFIIARFSSKYFGSCSCGMESLLVVSQKWIEQYFSTEINFFIGDLLGLLLLCQVFHIFYVLTTCNFHEVYKYVTDFGFGFSKRFSFVREILKEEENKLEISLDHDLKTKSRFSGSNTILPDKGMSHQEILTMIQNSIKHENEVWEKGQLSGSVYGGQREHIDFLNKCFSFYSIANALHPDIWPSVMKYESEVVAMTASLVNGGLLSVCGCTTSVCLFFFSSYFLPFTYVHINLHFTIGWHGKYYFSD
jgi:hypothetical protein